MRCARRQIAERAHTIGLAADLRDLTGGETTDDVPLR
jgi:hypothetical protein